MLPVVNLLLQKFKKEFDQRFGPGGKKLDTMSVKVGDI